jgi:hypothetical protein
LAAIFGTLGGIIALGLLYCACEKITQLFKKWRASRKNTAAIKPMTEDELGSDRKILN